MPPQDLWLPPHTCLSRPGPGVNLLFFSLSVSELLFRVIWCNNLANE